MDTNNRLSPVPHSPLQTPPNSVRRENQPPTDIPTPGVPGAITGGKRANIHIAPTQGLDHYGNWSLIYSTLRNEKIVVLTLQETHLTNDLLADVKSCYDKNMDIYNSSMPDKPRASGGIAIVLNRALIAPEETKTHILH